MLLASAVHAGMADTKRWPRGGRSYRPPAATPLSLSPNGDFQRGERSGCGGRAREEDREHGAAATGTTSGHRADANNDTDGRAGRARSGKYRSASRGNVTMSHNNPTRAWSRNTIQPLFPLDSFGAGIIIGAGPGGRCSLRAPRRLGKRGGRRDARAATPLPGAGTITER